MNLLVYRDICMLNNWSWLFKFNVR